MKWLELQIIIFILVQICITSGISGSTLIGPDGVTIGAAAFVLAINSGNVSCYPLK